MGHSAILFPTVLVT